MKIEEIYISGFGKLTDFKMSFTDGFNLIYGDNEDGKSTIMAFIKMMFYGCAVKKNDISKNPRKKYMPWDGSPMGGSISFEFEGSHYKLERSFGKTNSQDRIMLWNMDTDFREQLSGKEELGRRFFGISADTFDKSVYISQLGSTAGSKEAESEISQKLSNLISSGDESVSHTKVYERLVSAKEQLKSKGGKVGVLDKEYVRLSQLKDSALMSSNADADKMRMQNECDALNEDRVFYEQKYKELRLTLDIQEKVALLAQYEDFADQHISVETLKQQLAEKEEILSSGSVEVNDEFIMECTQLLVRVQSLEQRIAQMNDAVTRITGEIENITSAENNSGFGVLDEIKSKIDDITPKLQAYKGLLSSKQSQLYDLSEKVKNADVSFRIADERANNYDELSKQKIAIAEEQLRDASAPHMRHDNGTLDIKPVVTGLIIMVISVCLGIIDPIFIFGVSFGIIFIIYAIVQKQKSSGDYEFFDEIAISKANERLKKVRMDIEQERYYIAKNQKDTRRELSALRRDEQAMKLEISEMKEKINQTEQLLAGLENQKNAYEISLAGEVSKLSTKKDDLVKVKNDIVVTETNLKNATAQLLEYFSRYQHIESRKEIMPKLDKLRILLEEAKALRVRIESQSSVMDGGLETDGFEQTSAKARLLREELTRICAGEIPPLMSVEQKASMKQQMDAFFEKLQETNQKYTLLSAELKSKFKNISSVAEVEKSISELSQSIEQQEEYCQAIDIALSALQEAYTQMHSSFAPALNERTASIFSRLTNGKYGNLSVSKDFNIVLSDSRNMSRQWQYFSSGTADQVYFALRLAIAEQLSPENEKLPVMLDDIFIQYDDTRTAEGMKFLGEYSGTSQIIMFTCHSNMIDIARDNHVKTNLIKLS